MQILLSMTLIATAAPRPAPAPAALFTLMIQCPDTAKVECGTSTDPSITGTPTTSGECDPNHPATLTYTDTIVPPSCVADRFDHFITRHWVATDSCGNTASCDQTIDVVKEVWSFDIKAPSCPNPFNRGSGGVISMTIVGAAGQDVTQIDVNSVRLYIEHCTAGPVAPIRYSYDDKTAPFPGGTFCSCWSRGPDGILDLDFTFRKSDVRTGLQLDGYPAGTYVRITVTGTLNSGCGFLGTDCVRVQ